MKKKAALYSELIRLPGSFQFCGPISCLPKLLVYGQILTVAFGCPVVVVLNGQRVGESRDGGGPRARLAPQTLTT